MKRTIATIAAALLLAAAPYANAQPTQGSACAGPGCRAQDAATIGGTCIGHYCVSGGAGNSAGACAGNHCQAGNAGTVGGDCVGTDCKAGAARNSGGSCYGAGCRAGDGGTVGGDCYGKGCQAGNAGTMGGSCYGEGCKPGSPRGRAAPARYQDTDISCCVARGEFYMREFGRALDPRSCIGATATACSVRDRNGRPQQLTPAPDVPPQRMPAPPTSIKDLLPKKDPRCQFDCQSWNPASNSCVGAPMNGCGM
jgi:hypothetical protein